MRATTKLLAATAVALAAGALASAANAAAFVSVANSGSNSDNSVTWTQGTTAGAGTLSTNGAVTEHINFNDIFYNDGSGEDASFVISAHSTAGSTATQSGATYKETGVDGYFEFRSVANPSIVLLRGDFTGAWLTGADNSASFMSVMAPNGSLSFSSDVAHINGTTSPTFAFGFSGTHPGSIGLVSVTGGDAFKSFTATGVSGTFSAAVPEPATWALMIIGFGGAGAMLRSQRRKSLSVA